MIFFPHYDHLPAGTVGPLGCLLGRQQPFPAHGGAPLQPALAAGPDAGPSEHGEQDHGVNRERARQIEAGLNQRMREYLRERIPDFDLVAVPKG